MRLWPQKKRSLIYRIREYAALVPFWLAYIIMPPEDDDDEEC